MPRFPRVGANANVPISMKKNIALISKGALFKALKGLDLKTLKVNATINRFSTEAIAAGILLISKKNGRNKNVNHLNGRG